MKQKLLVTFISLTVLLLAGYSASHYIHLSFAQDDSGSDGGGAVGEPGCYRDNGNDCQPVGAPNCQDFETTTPPYYLPPAIHYIEPTKKSCPEGQTLIGYSYHVCTDTCNSTWVDSHQPECAPTTTTATQSAQQTATTSARQNYVCEPEVQNGTGGNQLQLKYLKCLPH